MTYIYYPASSLGHILKFDTGQPLSRDVPFATPMKIHSELAKLQPALLFGFICRSMLEEFCPKAKIMYCTCYVHLRTQSKQLKAFAAWWISVLSIRLKRLGQFEEKLWPGV